MPEILRCSKCGEYSLEHECKCRGECISPRPAKWSAEDKYFKYRMRYKKKYGNHSKRI